MVRGAVSDHDVVLVHKLLMLMGPEVAVAPVDPIIVMEDIYALVNEPNRGCFLMATRNGTLVGVLGLENARLRYSRHRCINEVYFFVHPDERGEEVGPALMREATAIAEMARRELYIRISNPNRRRGRKMDKVATLLRFQPAGAIYRVN